MYASQVHIGYSIAAGMHAYYFCPKQQLQTIQYGRTLHTATNREKIIKFVQYNQ